MLSIDHESAGLGWLRDPTPTADEIAGREDLDAWVRAAVLALPDRKRAVVHGMYWRQQPVPAIADTLAVSESRVWQIHTEAVGMIRDALGHHLHGRPGRPVPPVVARRRDAYRAAVLAARQEGAPVNITITLDRLLG